MKSLSILLLAVILFVGLSFAGKVFFGMGNGMEMTDVDCLVHCIDSSVLPVTSASAVSIFLFIACVFADAVLCDQKFAARLFDTTRRNRLTEPIRLFRLSQLVSTVVILD